MNKIGTKKLVSLGLLTLVATLLVAFSPSASADSGEHRSRHESSNQPKLDRITDVTGSQAVLSFRDRKFRNETVNVVVSIKTNDSNLVERQLKAKLDDEGRGTVTVKKLKSGTHYEFKLRIMRQGEERTTKNSNERSVRTD